MKTFKINKEYQIVCEWQKTKNGFKHTAELKKRNLWLNHNYRKELPFSTISETKVCYLNRTWESYEFETVIKKLLSMSNICKQTQTKFLNRISGKAKKEISQQFKSIAMVAQIGNLLCNEQKEKNDQKKRMLLAGFPLDIPEDWDLLNENEKENRLNNVINELAK